MELEVPFVDQPQRLRALDAARAAGAERVEALRDLLAEIHHVGGVALAQQAKRGLIHVLHGFLGLGRRVEHGFDRAEQRARNGTELFYRATLDFVEHAQGIAVCGVPYAEWILVHIDLPVFSA